MAKVKTGTNVKTIKYVLLFVIIMVIAVILAAVTMIIGYVSRDDNGNWFANKDLASWGWDKNTNKQIDTGLVFNENGEELKSDVVYAMPMGISFYAYDTTENNTDLIGPTVTVTVKQSMELNNIAVDWEILYPSGADASDCVTVTPESDGSLTATLQYVKSFDYQLTLKASVRGGSSYIECPVDCIKRITQSGNFYICSNDFSDNNDINVQLILGSGTVTPDVEIKQATFYVDTTFQSMIKRYLKFDITFKSYTQTYTNTVDLSIFGHTGYETDNQTYWSYDMLINNWADYDTDHQNAIMYAWYRAHKDFGTSQSSILTSLEVEIIYKGHTINVYQESDLVGNPSSYLSGECFGSDLEPDLTLNYNIAI